MLLLTPPGRTHLQLFVKASRSAQGGVEGMGPVCGSEDQQLTRVTLLETRGQRQEMSSVQVILGLRSCACTNTELTINILLSPALTDEPDHKTLKPPSPQPAPRFLAGADQCSVSSNEALVSDACGEEGAEPVHFTGRSLRQPPSPVVRSFGQRPKE